MRKLLFAMYLSSLCVISTHRNYMVGWTSRVEFLNFRLSYYASVFTSFIVYCRVAAHHVSCNEKKKFRRYITHLNAALVAVRAEHIESQRVILPIEFCNERPV